MTGIGRLLADLNQAGVRYVVVGGIAVIRHGVVRATKDVDVVIAATQETIAALPALFDAWKATRPDGSPETRRAPSSGWPLHLRTVHGLIDLMPELTPPLDLDNLVRRADERRVDGTSALVCSLVDLAAMKRLAGRPGDVEDIRRLEALHGTLPEPPQGPSGP